MSRLQTPPYTTFTSARSVLIMFRKTMRARGGRVKYSVGRGFRSRELGMMMKENYDTLV